MSSKLQDVSEIVVGMILHGRLKPTDIDASKLIDPYGKVFRQFNQKRRGFSVEGAVEQLGLGAVDAAMSAADKAVQTNGRVDWPRLLDKTWEQTNLADGLDQLAKRVRMGDPLAESAMADLIGRMNRGEDRLIRMTDVKPEKESFIPTGWDVIDRYIGNGYSRGIPKTGVTLVAGPPGTGKTSLMLKLISNFVKTHDVDAGIFTLEMTAGQLTQRALEIMPLTKKVKSRIWLCQEVLSPSDLASLAARSNRFKIVAVDFAELMIDGEVSESVMASAYRTIGMTLKNLNIPGVVLAQMNRNYDGNLPTMSMIRYTGIGEAITALGLLLFNPNQLLMKPAVQELLPSLPGRAYILEGKSRFGFTPEAPGIGAICAAFEGEKGWGDKAISWTPLTSS